MEIEITYFNTSDASKTPRTASYNIASPTATQLAEGYVERQFLADNIGTEITSASTLIAV